MQKFALLASMLYPSFDTNKDARFGGATSIAASPLFKLKVVNLVSSVREESRMLVFWVVVLGSIFSPDLEAGF